VPTETLDVIDPADGSPNDLERARMILARQRRMGTPFEAAWERTVAAVAGRAVSGPADERQRGYAIAPP